MPTNSKRRSIGKKTVISQTRTLLKREVVNPRAPANGASRRGIAARLAARGLGIERSQPTVSRRRQP